eukprot:scaffold35042_cov70-Phaeocystis_antarctica.AAC.2
MRVTSTEQGRGAKGRQDTGRVGRAGGHMHMHMHMWQGRRAQWVAALGQVGGGVASYELVEVIGDIYDPGDHWRLIA